MISRRRHAQIHLPPMTGEQAYLLAAALERAVRAIWRAHGDAMADFQGRVFPDAMPGEIADSVHHAMLDRLDQRSAKRASTDAQRHEHDPDDADLPW